ncbi:hypothetical protein L596_003734 [Steinernema carpocapsae]|uniref:Uncharacterized protein n=1 Tax=Steinernema carpocapsae TaxID=34508 RepID=A0A4U8UV46_STECR|nr:hypothetical protein L596_003734 [Steinernema carpocapsae]
MAEIRNYSQNVGNKLRVSERRLCGPRGAGLKFVATNKCPLKRIYGRFFEDTQINDVSAQRPRPREKTTIQHRCDDAAGWPSNGEMKVAQGGASDDAGSLGSPNFYLNFPA